jgi:hypothetical protein
LRSSLSCLFPVILSEEDFLFLLSFAGYLSSSSD